MAEWTVQQAEALAPDASSLKSGRDLASPRKWVLLGRSEGAAWGLCQGSGKDPYQACVDLSEPAFRCSCPSRKFPCKHGLGLFILLAAQPGALPEGETPAWAAEWLIARAGRAEKKAERVAARETAPPDPAAQAKRAEQRESRVASGVDQADLWLRDLVRAGLSSAPSRPLSYWEGIAARMIDAQAPGLARLIRECSGVHLGGEGWQDRLLEKLSRLYLLLEGYRRLENLPEGLRAEVRAQIGWTFDQNELLSTGTGHRDRWLVTGQRTEEEDRLRVQRTWLLGRCSGRPALLLAFAAGGQSLEPGPAPGTEFEAELVFFPGAWPLRALVRDRGPAEPARPTTDGLDSIGAAVARYGEAVAANPWLECLPFGLSEVVSLREGERWRLLDTGGHALPVRGPEKPCWVLHSLSAGRPIPVFGEWNGDWFRPQGAFGAAGYVAL